MLRKSTILSLMVITITLCFMLGMLSSAKALTIYANQLSQPSWELGTNYWTGDQISVPSINAIIFGIMGTEYTELYKSNHSKGYSQGIDEGSLAGSYNTIFDNTINDPTEATIGWNNGTPHILPIAYLLVKDGKATPAWYLFKLNNWDGQDSIELLNFWPGPGGAISHVSLYGKSTSVPEPTTLLLLGSGLLALGILRRKFKP